jgi:hypothetical protein
MQTAVSNWSYSTTYCKARKGASLKLCPIMNSSQLWGHVGLLEVFAKVKCPLISRKDSYNDTKAA